MSARLKEIARFRPMQQEDIAAIMEVEHKIYPFPWTLGNFNDSIYAGYSCWVAEVGRDLVGYAVLMMAPPEAHLLNIGIAGPWQCKGLGRKFLAHIIKIAREYHAQTMFLEVRPSNLAARKLYAATGFNEISIRREYYPGENGREDAILMALVL